MEAKYMKNIIINGILLTVTLFIDQDIFAQEKQVAQPTVMVVPYVDKGNMKGSFEEALQEPSQRMAISIAEEEFIANGLKTLSFQNMLENERKDASFQAGDGGDDAAKEDIRDVLSRKSGADIRVELDLTVSGSASNGSFKVKQTLRAIDPYTSEQLSLVSDESGPWSFNDTSKIARKALKVKMREFIDLMQQKFTDRINNGRDYIVDVTIDQSSGLTMSSMLGDSELGDLLYEFFEGQAYKSNLSEPRTEKVKFVIDRFKVPIRDENGNPYRLKKLEMGLKSLLKSKQIIADFRVSGGKMYVNIKK